MHSRSRFAVRSGASPGCGRPAGAGSRRPQGSEGGHRPLMSTRRNSRHAASEETIEHQRLGQAAGRPSRLPSAPMERLPKTLPAGNRSGMRRVGRANGERPKTATATNSPTMTREPVRYHAKSSRRARKVGAGPRRMSGLHRNTGCRGTNDANHAFGDQALRGPCRGVAFPLPPASPARPVRIAADRLSRNVRSAAGFPASGKTPARGSGNANGFPCRPRLADRSASLAALGQPTARPARGCQSWTDSRRETSTVDCRQLASTSVIPRHSRA